MFHSGLRITALMKYFKRIKPSKEERIQSVLPKPDCPLARLMLTLLSSAKKLLIRCFQKFNLSKIARYITSNRIQ